MAAMVLGSDVASVRCNRVAPPKPEPLERAVTCEPSPNEFEPNRVTDFAFSLDDPRVAP